MIEPVIAITVGLALGAFAALFIANRQNQSKLEAAEELARQRLHQAEVDKNLRAEDARTEAQELLGLAETELTERKEAASEAEERLAEKAKDFDRRSQTTATLQRKVAALEEAARAIHQDVSEVDHQMLERLAEVSGVSIDQASAERLAILEQNIREDTMARMREMEADIKERADEICRDLLADTVQRLNTPVVSNSPGSSVPLTERELKRVIAAPGLLEQISELAGTTLTINEESASVNISASDAVKRELSRLSLTEILKGGRVSPRDVERLVRKQEQRLEKSIWDGGIAAARSARVGRLPDDVVAMFGRLQYRYSYGQNQLLHAVETAHLAAMLARELGADIEIARTGGLLHDLGKAIDRDVEGTHAQLGGQLALDSGMDPLIAHCISAHHEEIEPETTEAIITIVADAMSGARPGARRESLDGYLARLEAIEAVAHQFPGVEKCYAIQAGRELRVIVRPETVDDEGATRIAQAISQRIQDSLEYPGQIKVMVIRETRSVEHARHD